MLNISGRKLRNPTCRAQRDKWGFGVTCPYGSSAELAGLRRDLADRGGSDLLAGSTSCGIGFLRKLSHEAKKRLRLADENVHINEALERDGGSILGRGWPNDGTYW